VAEQYATEANLAARKSVYVNAEGPDARDVAFQAVAEAQPRRVLEVGGGEGELAERIVRELGAELVGIDQSERMVEIQRSKGLDARVGDVQQLPFADGEFDIAVAAWMLYHAPDLDRGLAELARVLEPGGRLVAVVTTNDHLLELWEHAGRDVAERGLRITRENAREILGRHFRRIEQVDVDGFVTFDDDAVRRYAGSSPAFGPADAIPPLSEPLRVRTGVGVFVAHT
jgi:SAM-dependent methyltransferase